MSVPIVGAAPVSPTDSQPGLQVKFVGVMRGEFLKVARLFWGMLAILTVAFIVGFLLGGSSPDAKANLQTAPLLFLYNAVESNMVVFRIFSGIFLIVFASFTIGREYQYGTIRILVARGVGRVQLLLAKLAMLGVVAVALLLAFTALTALLTCAQMSVLVGNLDALSALTPAFWPNIGIDLLATFISMGATILMAVAMNALARSLAVGMALSLMWFPADNVATLIMKTLERITQSSFWSNASSYFLGPLLNRLPTILLPADARSGFESFGSGQLVSVSVAHALWVIGAYALAFAALAFISTWKRDVTE